MCIYKGQKNESKIKDKKRQKHTLDKKLPLTASSICLSKELGRNIKIVIGR